MRQRNIRLKEYIQDVLSIKWILVGVVFYFYGVLLKNEVVRDAYEMSISFNNWDITLRMLNDMYLIVFFIIPVVLFFSTKTILVDFDYQILIRLGSFKNWVYNSLKQFWKKGTPLLFVWIFMSLFMTIGFPYSWNWSQVSGIKHSATPLYELINFFTPLSAFLSQCVLLILTISLLHIMLAIVYVLTKSKHFLLSISGLVFLGGVLGFKLLPKKIAFLSPPTFFSLTAGVNTFGSPIVIYLVILGIGILSILFLQILDLQKKTYINSIKSYIPIGCYIFLCTIGIIYSANSLKESSGTTILDVWVASFVGVNAESFSYIPFFYYAIVFFGFTYLVQLFLSTEVEMLGYYKIIRYRNLNKWFWNWMKKLLTVAALFFFILMGLSLIIAVLFGMKPDFHVTIFSNQLYEVLYHFFVNGFLQIMFYIIAVFIVSWVSKESIYGVLLISVFMVLLLPGINETGFIPVGLNSIVYLMDYSPYSLTLILILANGIALGIVNYLFKQSLKI